MRGRTGTCPDRRANHISLHWNGAISGQAVRLDRNEFDLVNGEWNDVTVIAEQVEDGMIVTVAIVDADGKRFVPFTDYFVEGASSSREPEPPSAAAPVDRLPTQRIDDVYISWTGDGRPGG